MALRDTDYIEEKAFVSLSADCDELVRRLSSITKTLREKSVGVHESPDTAPFFLYATPNS